LPCFHPSALAALLRATGSQALHLLMDAAIGVIGLLALAACIFAWRLSQGPIDISALVKREESLLAGPGTQVSIGSAQLAWEGFVSRNRPLDIRVHDARISAGNGGVLAQLPQARVTLSIPQLLIGRLVPRDIDIEGASVQLERLQNGALRLGLGQPEANKPEAEPKNPGWIVDELTHPSRLGDTLPWLSQLHRVQVRGASVSIRAQHLGVLWQAGGAEADFLRLPNGGVSGQAKLNLAVADIHATLALSADLRPDGTHLWGSTTRVSPAALSRVAPQIAALGALDAPVATSFDAVVGPELSPRSARLTLSIGAGSLAAGNGRVALQSAELVFSAKPAAITLESMRVATAQIAGKAKPPVLTGSARAALESGRVHASFDLSVDGVAMADLSDYWPDGVAKGSRGWLTQNIVAGLAHDAHVAGAFDAKPDFSDVQVTALSGGLQAEDVSVFWLRPIPPVTHGKARLTIEGPDKIHIAIDAAEQDQLRLAAGSSVDITKLTQAHQFGDIDVHIEGPLDTALTLLNHPRLKLLARSGIDFTGASGTAQARLQMHLPLEDRVTMDDIATHASAELSDVHLAKIADERDLDHGRLSIKVTNDGLKLSGHGDFGGIPTDLALDMSFLDGPSDQVLQHVTADGTATPAQLTQFALPGGLIRRFSGGTTAIHADYAARRNRTSTLQIDADLSQSTLTSPFGWNKQPGPSAAAGVRFAFSKGALVGVDRLHAEGPGLLIASHVQLAGEHMNALVLDRLELGRTRAHGRIGFPATAADPVVVSLSGAMLDVSGYFAESQAERAQTVPTSEATSPPTPSQRGQRWRADLDFAQVVLAKGKIFAPVSVSAENDGLHLERAAIRAGAAGDITASITPEAATRRLEVRSADAGLFLRAMGVADNLEGGTLELDGVFADALPDDPLTGTARLQNFTLRTAPAIGRLLQAMTLYGLTDALRGPGLHFSKLEAPFRWQHRVLTLRNARAFSPSLGLTAEGDIDLGRRVAAVKGTVVPAYFFNQLLGRLPLIGKIFSPEKGGGVFAARYSVTGPLADPKVGVNPLSALTPGFLREGFGLLSPKP
jgi:hypothetical protein